MSWFDADGAPKSYYHAGLAQAAWEDERDDREADYQASPPPCEYCGRGGRYGHARCGEEA